MNLNSLAPLRLTRTLLLAVALAAALPAFPILLRADRDDAEYLELATHYPAAIALPGGGGAALVAPRWVLTAAHRAKALQEMRPAPKLQVGGREYAIAAIHIHPSWKPGESGDIALVFLRDAANAVEPARFYRGGDEAGKGVVTVGHGEAGKIGAASTVRDGKKRAAINTVDRVQPRVLGLKIKPGDEASDLQGALAPGDSGAPAFIDSPEGIFVAGVAYATEKEWNLYARVSAYVPWLEAVMLDASKREMDSLLDPDRR